MFQQMGALSIYTALGGFECMICHAGHPGTSAGWDARRVMRRLGFAFFGVFNGKPFVFVDIIICAAKPLVTAPGTELNPDFEANLAEVAPDKEAPVILVCRSLYIDCSPLSCGIYAT